MARLVCVLLAALWLAAPGVAGPRFDDVDPVTWTGRAPQAYPVHGIDAARFQTGIDWALARRAGISFAFVKATEGGDLLDPMFKTHWQGARQAGVPVGAYHFYYFCSKPRLQARWFIQNVRRERGALPPVLDVEWNPFSPTCTTRPSAEEVRRVMAVWMNVVGRHYGQRPIIYTTPDFYRTNELWRLKDEEFWLRSVAQTPDRAYPGQRWRFWQYTGTGLVPGIAGKVDINVFYGTKGQWRRWLKKRTR